MRVGSKEFDLDNKCYIMGILNVTPDSFSDGGKWDTIDKSLRHAQSMVEQGADIIDVGGESSRPGHEKITVNEELDRVLPVIEEMKKRIDIPISVDTCKSGVAKAALRVGADMVNDIWGLKNDEEMAGVISEAGVPCCLMHNRDNMDYSDFISDLIEDLHLSINLARNAGISKDNIILDPGIGFAKTHEMNLEAINRLDEIRKMGYPVLLGASRKRVVGLTLDLPVNERVEGSIAAAIIGLVRGSAMIRVHDVKETFRAIKMAETILKV